MLSGKVANADWHCNLSHYTQQEPLAPIGAVNLAVLILFLDSLVRALKHTMDIAAPESSKNVTGI